MKDFIDKISDKTPRIFARIAAFSVALGVLSVAVAQAPADIKALIPDEVIQGAKYLALLSWATNLFSIAQREYESHVDTADDEMDVSPENDIKP